MTEPRKLKLQATNLVDLEIISSVLQDAAIKVGDMTWLPDTRRFGGVGNRYRWEGEARGGSRGHERVRTGFHFESVLSVAYRNIPRSLPDHVLELLAIKAELAEDGATTILFEFAGFATIRLETECIDAFLEDLSKPWRARARPEHKLEND